MSDSVTQRVNKFLQQFPIISMSDFLRHEICDPEKKDILWTLIPQSNDNTKEAGSRIPFSDDYLHMCLYVRNLFKNVYAAVEGRDIITQKTWSSSQTHGLQGGGIMTTIRGDILEKSAVNLSVVSGAKYPGSHNQSNNQLMDPAVKPRDDTEKYAVRPFVAAGVSVISHPKNPFAPIMHFNIRHIKVFGENETYQWIGGGADLTPMEVFEEDTHEFHDALKQVCQKHPGLANYENFRKWADDYFYIPHRKEIRGVGGIFFDFLPITSDLDTGLLFDLGQHAAHTYAKILARRVNSDYGPELVQKHHYWRGRYAEFNLIYDRGTRFGLMSGGNHEAIFCSLPPQVRW